MQPVMSSPVYRMASLVALASGVSISLGMPSRSYDAESSSAPLSFTASSPAPTYLPDIQCIEVVSLIDSVSASGLRRELSLLGWEHKAEFLQQLPDPQGKDAGCFRSHVLAYKKALARGCDKALILEDDARFMGAVLNQGMEKVQHFLNNASFDILLLGWESNIFTGSSALPSTVEGTGYECIYGIRRWFETHAYIISHSLMEKMASVTFEGIPIDVALAHVAANSTYLVTPKLAFQQLHASQAQSQSHNASQTGGVAELLNENPFIFYSLLARTLFAINGITVPKACLPPADAFVPAPTLSAHEARPANNVILT